MLSLGKVRRSGIGYYFEALGPRPFGLVEADGVWLGSQAASLELGPAPVGESALRALLDGIDPTTGEVLDPHHANVLVVAYDAVFAAPKSVSVIHALGSADVRAEIGRAHEASVAAVIAHLEPEIGVVRRSGPQGRRTLPAAGVVAAGFVHRTSRAPDPHLHTHVVLANLGLDRTGRWSALDGRALFEQQRVAGALYGSELRRGLVERLGLDFRVRRPGVIDVVGLSDTVLAAFSRRLAEIELERARSGAQRGRAARLAGERTRPPKDLTTSYETLVDRWREEAYRLGVAPRAMAPPRPAVAKLLPLVGGVPDAAEVRAASLGDALGAALDSFDRPFLRRDLVAATARRVVAGATTGDLVAATDAALVSPVIEVERGAGSFPARPWGRVPPVGFSARYVTREAGARLGGIAAAIGSAPDLGRFVVLDPAGEGRVVVQPTGLVAGPQAGPLATLEMLRALGEGAQRAGRRVLGVAPYAALAAHLEGLTGIAAGGVDELALPRHGEVVVVFGAARIAARGQAALIERAATVGSAVVFVDLTGRGDRRAGPRPSDGRDASLVLQDLPGAAGLPSEGQRDNHRSSERVGDDGLEMLLAPSLSRLGAVLESACARVLAADRHPIIVLADRMLGDDLGVPSSTPAAALRLERSDPKIGLVVVGGRGVVPAARRHDGEIVRRVLVALAPTRELARESIGRAHTKERGPGRDDRHNDRSFG